MPSNRAAPAYQEYAADMLAGRRFRLMRPGERGLLYSMRLCCWVDGALPAEPQELARIVGLDLEDVVAALSAVMPYFALADGEIHSPELDAYRARLDEQRARQIAGGKAGAARTNTKNAKRSARKNGVDHGTPGAAANPSSTTTATPAATPASPSRVLSRVEKRREEKKREERRKEDRSNHSRMSGAIASRADDHAQAERVACTPEAYRRATRGV